MDSDGFRWIQMDAQASLFQSAIPQVFRTLSEASNQGMGEDMLPR